MREKQEGTVMESWDGELWRPGHTCGLRPGRGAMRQIRQAARKRGIRHVRFVPYAELEERWEKVDGFLGNLPYWQHKAPV